MTYHFRFRKSAADEYEACCGTYSCRGMLDEWLEEIAARASRKDESKSIDATEVFEVIENMGQWRAALKRFKKVPLRQKLKALMHVVKNRHPPWQFRMQAASLSFLDATFRREVHAYFEVNHVDKLVIFHKFNGLPPGPEIDGT